MAGHPETPEEEPHGNAKNGEVPDLPLLCIVVSRTVLPAT